MRSPLTSCTEISPGSTRAHWAIQLGNASKLLPTRCCITSYLTSAASAGVARYSMAMNSSDQATERRVSATLGVV